MTILFSDNVQGAPRKGRVLFQDNEEYKEPLKTSNKGLQGVLMDAISKGISLPFDAASSLIGLPGEAIGASKQLLSDYPRYAKNTLSGFGELGHKLLNINPNIRDYLVSKELLPEETPSFRLPESILPKNYNYAEALGVKGSQPGDELIRSGPALLAAAGPGGEALNALKEIPFTKKLAARPLEEARKTLKERGSPSVTVPNDLIKESEDFLPRNLPTKNLLKKALSGDYDTLFTLQSDLGKSARELTSSASGAERLHGFQAHDLRSRLLEGMKSNLESQGHGDISELLSKGQNKYRQHMKYRKPLTYAATGALGTAGLSGIYEILKHIL